GELRDLDTIAARGRLLDHSTQKKDFPAPFPHRHGKILYPRLLTCKVGQFMKMGREQDLGPSRIVQMLCDGPRDREAIKRAGPATDLVEQKKAALRQSFEQARGLAHFDHEG